MLITPDLHAQSYSNVLDSIVTTYRVNKAGKAFDNMAYAQSIRRYEPLYQKGYLADSVKCRLAQAYLKVQETEKAEEVYASVGDKGLSGDDLFYYAQVLKYNGKYAEADHYMALYLHDHADDSRALKQVNSLPVIEQILSEKRYVVEELDVNSSESDFGPTLVDDQMVFVSAREVDVVIRRKYAWKETPYLNLFSAQVHEDSIGRPGVLSAGLKSMYHDGPVCANADGTELFITRNSYHHFIGKKADKGYNHLNLMMALKQADGKWGKPVYLPFNQVGYSTGHGFLVKDGSRLYFASDRPGGMGGSDIWYVNRTESGWSEPVNLGKDINTEGNEMFPFVDNDQKLYFASNGHLGLGGLDLFVAVQSNKMYRVQNMGYPINSSKDDFGLYLSDDQCGGYFSSNREGGMGDDDIYRFKVLNPIGFNKYLKSRLIDKYTCQIVTNTRVQIKNAEGDVIKELVSDNSGEIEVELPQEISQVILEINSSDYYPYKDVILLTDDMADNDIELMPRLEYGIYGGVFLLPENSPIADVSISIESKDGELVSLLSNQDGQFKAKLMPDTDYDLVFTKKEYFTRRIAYSTKGRDAGYVNVNEFMKLELEKAEVDKSIEIQIFYDLGQWNIREDAAVELDDMIQFLNENPTIKIELGSHTDARGSAKSNQILSLKRAESAVMYIVEQGISPARISARGYGELRLKNQCADGVSCSEELHQANRRSEVTIKSM